MDFATTVLLGTVAGLTIFLGLPVARVRVHQPSALALLNALATGILVFLLWDILTRALEPINKAVDAARHGQASNFGLLALVFVAGFGLGMVGLVYFERAFKQATDHGPEHVTGRRLALTIATGIGLHNFSEGLAMGQSSRAGALDLALLLVIGFGLHNATEGFGIAAPLANGPTPSWRLVSLAGLIAGGPTVIGTIVGYGVDAEPLFVLFLALAAGSIFYVVSELLHVGRRFQQREMAMWGVCLGFLAAYATDLMLIWAGG